MKGVAAGQSRPGHAAGGPSASWALCRGAPHGVRAARSLLTSLLQARGQGIPWASRCLGEGPSNCLQAASRARQGLAWPFSVPLPRHTTMCSAAATLAFGPSQNRIHSSPPQGLGTCPSPGLACPRASARMSLPGRDLPGHMSPCFTVLTAVIYQHL